MMVVINLSITFISHRQSIKGHHNDVHVNDTEHNVNTTVRSIELSIMTRSITTLRLIILSIVTQKSKYIAEKMLSGAPQRLGRLRPYLEAL